MMMMVVVIVDDFDDDDDVVGADDGDDAIEDGDDDEDDNDDGDVGDDDNGGDDENMFNAVSTVFQLYNGGPGVLTMPGWVERGVITFEMTGFNTPGSKREPQWALADVKCLLLILHFYAVVFYVPRTS